MKKFDQKEIELMVKRMRRKAFDMAFHAGANGAHLGGGLSCMEIMAVLYGSILNFDSKNTRLASRDRFIISKAHGVLAYYTALQEAGFLNEQDLARFEENGWFLTGHPSINMEHGIEFSGGSLGLGPGLGIGVALAGKKRKIDYRVFVLLGDGECQEGSVWEAAIAAPNFQLDNLVLIVDRNQLQYDGPCDQVMGIPKLGEAFKEFGWEVVVVDGHDITQLYQALSVRYSKPSIIIANTIKGKGVSFMENNKDWHHGRLNQQQYEIAISELEATYG